MLLIIGRRAGVFVRNTLRPSVLGLTECHSFLNLNPDLDPSPDLDPDLEEQAGNNFPELSESRTKLWQGLLTLPTRRPKDRSPTRTPAGNLRSGRRRSGKNGWGHPLCGTNVSL